MYMYAILQRRGKYNCVTWLAEISNIARRIGIYETEYTKQQCSNILRNQVHWLLVLQTLCHLTMKAKGKSVPLQAWSDPEGSRKLRFPDFMTTAQDGGKFFSLTYRPLLPPGNTPGTHFC